MRLGASVRCHALHKIEDAFRRAAFLLQNGLDDLAGLGLAEPALAQEGFAVVIGAGNDTLPRRLDAGDEWRGRGIGKARQRGRGPHGRTAARQTYCAGC